MQIIDEYFDVEIEEIMSVDITNKKKEGKYYFFNS
jgi:hypothetical protein